MELLRGFESFDNETNCYDYLQNKLTFNSADQLIDTITSDMSPLSQNDR